jgi:hypothetical protein
MIEALQTIVAACKGARKRAALHCGMADYWGRTVEWGFQMTTVFGGHVPACCRGSGQHSSLSRIDRCEGRPG